MAEPSLFAAFTAWFEAEPDLAEAFPGGLIAGRSGVAQRLPYARAVWRKPKDSLSLDDEQFRIDLVVYAETADDAESLGELLAARYLDDSRPPLEFEDRRGRSWRESARVEQDAIGPEWAGTVAKIPDDPASYEGDTWRYRVPFVTWVVPA